MLKLIEYVIGYRYMKTLDGEKNAALSYMQKGLCRKTAVRSNALPVAEDLLHAALEFAARLLGDSVPLLQIRGIFQDRLRSAARQFHVKH